MDREVGDLVPRPTAPPPYTGKGPVQDKLFTSYIRYNIDLSLRRV